MPEALPVGEGMALDQGVLLFSLVLSLGVGFLFGLAPAVTTGLWPLGGRCLAHPYSTANWPYLLNL